MRSWEVRVLLAVFVLLSGFVVWKADELSSLAIPQQVSRTKIDVIRERAVSAGFISNEKFSEPTFTYRENAQHTGVAKSLYLSPNLKEVWRTEKINIGVHGASKSSPAIDATGIYVGADSGWFYKFDHDGKVVWKFRADRSARGIHGTAALDADYVYFGAYNGRFYCLRKTDGALVWFTQLMDAIGSSPVIDQEFIYVSSERGSVLDGYLFKLDRKTGRTIWYTINFGEQVHSSPALSMDRRLIFVGANNGYLFAFHAADGSLAWRTDVGGAVKGTPLVHNGSVYVTTWGQEMVAVSFTSGIKLWSAKFASKSQSSPTYVEGLNQIVVGTSAEASRLYGISLTKKQIVWEKELKDPHSRLVMGSGVTAIDPKSKREFVIIPCGKSVVCAIDPIQGKTISEVDVQGIMTSVPSVFDGAVYVALDEGAVVKIAPSGQ